MEVGRYTVRSGWRPVSSADRVLLQAVVEVDEDGTVLVHVDGEALLAYPDGAAFFRAYSVTARDLERAAELGTWQAEVLQRQGRRRSSVRRVRLAVRRRGSGES